VLKCSEKFNSSKSTSECSYFNPTSPISLRRRALNRGDAWASSPELSTYLPPMVVIALGLLGSDTSSEPQVPSDVQGPQSLLVPKSYTDGFQSLPFTGNRDENRAVSAQPDQGRGLPVGLDPTHKFQGRKLEGRVTSLCSRRCFNVWQLLKDTLKTRHGGEGPWEKRAYEKSARACGRLRLTAPSCTLEPAEVTPGCPAVLGSS